MAIKLKEERGCVGGMLVSLQYPCARFKYYQIWGELRVRCELEYIDR